MSWTIRRGPTLAAVIGLALTLNLGGWQLRRHGERNAHYADAVAAEGRPPVTTLDGPDAAELRWRRATLRGDYIGEPMLLSGRRFGEAHGYSVLQGFRTTSGRSLLVERGFVPGDAARDVSPGPVSVEIDGQMRPITGSADARPFADRLGAASVWPPGARAAMLATLPPPRHEDMLVLGPPIVEGTQPRGVPPIAGYEPVRWDTTSRDYALTWFGLAALIALMWAGTGLERARTT